MDSVQPPAAPINSNRRRSNEPRERKSDTYFHQIETCSRDTNLIATVQSSHLDRLIVYLDRKKDHECNNVRVLGSATANCCNKSVSLLFLSCNFPTEMGRELQTDPLLARVINKAYVVQPGLMLKGDLSTEQGCNYFAEMLFDKVIASSSEYNDARSTTLRVQLFPPTEQSRLLRSINDKNTDRQFTISPRGFKHMLSVVEVYRYKYKEGQGRERKHEQDEKNKFYMVGLAPASYELDVVDNHNSVAVGKRDDVGRAYYKLKEAIEMYEAARGPLPRGFQGAVALDCGASPGGWTKYLVERFRCAKVYSIDPGPLAPSVTKLKATIHMTMKVRDALPILMDDESAAGGHIKLWVSDMCLHNVEDQIDPLLFAREKGLLAPDGALFVLTLKCKLKSASSISSFVQKAIRKLGTSTTAGVKIFHLFSNRSGERTVIGYIK